MREQTRKRLQEDASVGLDLSPGDPNITEALVYIKALEEVEEVAAYIDDAGMLYGHPGTSGLLHKALKNVKLLRTKEEK